VSPRNTAAGAQATRDRIVGHAVKVATGDGFEAASLGRLAADLSLSKAGVIGHFGTMDALHLAAVEAAADRFRRQVWAPAAKAPPGLPRLEAICERWIAYLQGGDYVGGCFVSGEHHRAATVREAVADAQRAWRAALVAEIEAAQAADDVPAAADSADIAFALSATAGAIGQSLRLGLDPQAAERGRRLMRQALAAPPTP
jgi:AcrR family transcriptional regulator